MTIETKVASDAAQQSCCGPLSKAAPILHPLEPLTPAEIEAARGIVLADPRFAAGFYFETIELKEPIRAEVRAFTPGSPIQREARVNLFEGGKVGVWRLTLSLARGEILTAEHIPGAKPMIKGEQFLKVEAMVKANPEFIAACKKRGIEDMSLVCVDPWSAGNFDFPGEAGRHLCHTFAWVRTRPDDNLYAHPIEGVNAVIDINTWEILRVDDYGVVPIPQTEYNYEAQFRESFRDYGLTPINVTQPEGVSFKLEGRRITWARWSAVIGFSAREGLILHDVRFDDRPVVYRMALAEMVVPYGSPERGHFRKSVFDIGEYGLGSLANPLELGCDCLGVIQYLDVWYNGMDGKPICIKNGICIHEEDAGILWKHTDFRTDRPEVRRNRRLVISSLSTVGNYEYGSYWYFYLDGMIEFEMKATGIINTLACEPGATSKYSQEVVPGVMGQIHQHAFCARIDPAVDGDENSVVELNTYSEPPGPGNPYGNAFYQQATLLETESEGQRKVNQATHRGWKFINPNKVNKVGQPVGYKLDAGSTVTSFFQEGSPSGTRSNFMQNQLWVTAYDPEQRFPAGEYMNHSDGKEGLVRFVEANRPIANKEIVAWHVFGLHHMPRVEDFPVQSCISTGFKLMPSGFFDQNPCMDLPPETNKASRHAGESCCS